MTKTLKYWSPVAICISIIFVASSVPGSNIPILFPWQDNAFHFTIYLLLCMFLRRALLKTLPRIKPVEGLILTVAFGIIYGIIDELHQSFVPNRSASFADILIDSLGALTGSLLAWPR
ncbi:MAG: VanZ family protein [Candidatus Omnitrophica bacterium]|nr:VanZ family protein [Candidatus Omnitrophota bacterium]